MRFTIFCGMVFMLAGCADWKRSGNEMLRSICRDADNCYASCPDGRRTDPSDPYCPGEPPQKQPEPF